MKSVGGDVWSQAERDAFLAARFDEIRRIARCLVAGQADPLMLVDDAPAFIWERLEQYDRDRPFRPWCYTVLRREFISRCRQAQRERERRGPGKTAGPTPVEWLSDRGEQAHLLSRQMELSDPFPDSDLAKIRAWPLTTRLILLGFYGLHGKVRPEEWSRWLAAYPLPPDFPGELLAGLWRGPERVARLGAVLDRKPNSISRTLRRRTPMVLELQSVRSLTKTIAGRT